MNQCQSYCRLIKRMGASTPKVSVWQSIINTCTENIGKSYTDSATTFGSVGTTTDKWADGALASNGKIYCRPLNSSSILVIDTSNDTTSMINGISGSTNWSNFIIAKDGYIYGAPYNVNTFIKIDPQTDTFTTFESTVGNGWGNLCSSESGLLYGFRSGMSSTSVLVFDPIENTQTTITSQINTYGLTGFRCHPNGCIYAVPSDATYCYCLKTSDGTASSFGSLGSKRDKYIGCNIGYNENVYGIPSNASGILRINATNNTASTFGSTGASVVKWIKGVLAPNRCIYATPSYSSKILKINTESNTYTTFGGSYSTSLMKWQGGILAPNGCIYGIPRSASTVLKINPGASVNTNFSLEALLSPYIN